MSASEDPPGAERQGSGRRGELAARDELEGWQPTPPQAALLAELCERVATADPAAWELLNLGADGLAELLGDTCVASLLSDQHWMHPLGVADGDTEVQAVVEDLVGDRLRADRGFARRIFSSGRLLRLSEPIEDVVLAGRPELGAYVKRFGISSAILAPMRARGRALGELTVLRRPGRTQHTPDDERFVQLVADWLAVAAASTNGTDLLPAPATGRAERDDLSEREQEVLALLAQGHTNREIAERLFLSVRTVEWHRARLQWKLGVSGRAALTRRAGALGLIE